jgi:hypothetical protein
MRLFALCLGFTTLLFSTTLIGAQTPLHPLEGRWKFRIPQGEESLTFLFAFSQADGKWVGDYISATAQLKAEPKVDKVTVSGDKVQFTTVFGGREFLNFDGVIAKDGKKITGSFSQFGSPLQLTELYPSKLKKLDDPFELARENLQQAEAGPALFDPAFTVLGSAASKKIPMDEVRLIVDKLQKASSNYGARWENTTTLKIAKTLAEQEGFADVALTQIRRAERQLADDAPVVTQMEVFETITKILTKSGKADEAKKYASQLVKLETLDYTEYTKKTQSFAPKAYAGRKAKSERVSVIEVFTGAECPPCAAVDVACDAVLATYKPSEVIVLNYHFHVPAPDPLTSFDSMERAGFYQEQIRGAPTIFLNGILGPKGGGAISGAKDKYAEITKMLDPALETPATVKLTLTATPGDKGLVAKASVTDLAKPGDKIMLRFAVAEERIRYLGGNGIRYHHMVVRELPGGVKGQALTKASQDVTTTVNVKELREKLVKYLDDFTKTEGEFPRPDRPLDLKNLKLVAFVQNDATSEILNATMIDLEAKSEAK